VTVREGGLEQMDNEVQLCAKVALLITEAAAFAVRR